MTFDPAASIQQDAQQAQAAVPQPVRDSILSRFRALIEPNPLKPDDFKGKFIALKINQKLDGPDEASSQAMLGESINLCLVALAGASGGDLPPIAHLAWSGFKFVDIRRSTQRGQAAEAVTQQQEPTKR